MLSHLEMSKLYQENFKSSMPFGTVVSRYLRSHFTEKKLVGENSWRKSFPSSENAIWSILLKYQKIDVQIHTFTDET